MPGLFVSHLPSQLDPQNSIPAVETMNWRRTGHGSSAVPQRPVTMLHRQPQDGALDSSRIATLRSTQPALTGEPEDARLTGGTRSLMRRVMGLNVAAPLRAVTTRRAARRAPAVEPQVA